MGIFHFLSRLLMSLANNTDVIMFTFSMGIWIYGTVSVRIVLLWLWSTL